MIRLIIFDMDGVLVDAREIHYNTLNKALREIAGEEYVIRREEHLAKYNGLPTTAKLQLLEQEKGLSPQLFNKIWAYKQTATLDIASRMTIDYNKCGLLNSLRALGYDYICCASNSIRATTKMMLLKTGLLEHLDKIYSNQDVQNPKPSPQMFLQCMLDFNVGPTETLIIEDSHIGRKAAMLSGAHVLEVSGYNDVTIDLLVNKLKELNNEKEISPMWNDQKLNVLIPMAGAGSRFAKAGYTFPKPLIEIRGKPMIEVVVKNLNINAHYIYLCQKEHCDKYNLRQLLRLITPKCTIVEVDGVTEGAACTTLLAKYIINTANPLLIVNSDQWIKWNSNECMYSFSHPEIDGGILCFKSHHPKWSFVSLDSNGFVNKLAEKSPISDNATCGIYHWQRGQDYVKYAEQMISKNLRVNGEFYVAPVYNEAIADGKKIKPYFVEEMWGLGTPEDLDLFVKENKK